ncbi:MAG: hypothetical protein IIW54_06380 [Lachnospiraceae bacterium]|jgi:hypothetical protein|nr:hypothetical protein [Lachnospiraceae bacterium]
MKKYILILAMLLSHNQSASCQVTISLDTLFISNVVDKLPYLDKNGNLVIIDEDKEQGPYINVGFTIENKGIDTLYADTALDFTHPNEVIEEMIRNGDDSWDIKHSDKGGLYLIFYLNGKTYEIIPSFIYPVDRGPLLPDEKQKLKFGDWLFLGTDIKKDYGYDYSKEVIECLPTVQVVYEYKNQLYKSCGVKIVKYIDE